MNRRSFLASSSVVLADQMFSHAGPVWALGKSADKARTHYTLRIEPCKLAVDFVADNPGDTLLHCHQALHMDFGFMQLMKYVG